MLGRAIDTAAPEAEIKPPAALSSQVDAKITH